MSPSGKAAGSGPAIRGFESLHPSHLSSLPPEGFFDWRSLSLAQKKKAPNLRYNAACRTFDAFIILLFTLEFNSFSCFIYKNESFYLFDNFKLILDFIF